MDALSLNEIQERQARINTFVRFNRVNLALVDCYSLRLDIQLSGLARSTSTSKAAEEVRTLLGDLELLIEELERRKFNNPGTRLQKLMRKFQLMMQGKDEEDRLTLE